MRVLISASLATSQRTCPLSVSIPPCGACGGGRGAARGPWSVDYGSYLLPESAPASRGLDPQHRPDALIHAANQKAVRAPRGGHIEGASSQAPTAVERPTKANITTDEAGVGRR